MKNAQVKRLSQTHQRKPEEARISAKVKVGKVYARDKLSGKGEAQWAFNLELDGNVKGYAFSNRRDAVKGRVLIRKKLQEHGLKILS